MISHISTVIPISTLPQRETNISAAQVANAHAPALPPISSAAQKDGISSNAQQGGSDSPGRGGTSSQYQQSKLVERNLEFSVDKDSGDLVVKVVNPETREVIRQMPREEVLAFAQHIKEYQQGRHGALLEVKA